MSALQSPDVRTRPAARTARRRAALGSFVGTTIEWYDYYLYGTAAAIVLGPLFFPDVGGAVGVVAAFATYAVGFLARPLGGAVAGHVGDRVGRKAVLVASLLVMGVSTTAVGLLPTHAQIGVWAPVLLVLCRLLQGFSAGGEWGGAVLLAVEHAPTGRRGLFGAIPQTGSAAGMVLASGGFWLTRSLTDDDAFLAWGWRLPFLASAVLVVVGLLIRLKVTESPTFAAVRDAEATARRPWRRSCAPTAAASSSRPGCGWGRTGPTSSTPSSRSATSAARCVRTGRTWGCSRCSSRRC